MSSQVCWRCGIDPGSWTRINDRVWCDDCLGIAAATFVTLAVFKVPLFAVVKAVADEHVAGEIVKALEMPR